MLRTALSALLLVAVGSPSPPKHELVPIAGGRYRVGKADRLDNPLRTITLKPFHIANLETTNDEFAAFVQATGHTTDAERLHNAMVFETPLKEFRWIRDPTACW